MSLRPTIPPTTAEVTHGELVNILMGQVKATANGFQHVLKLVEQGRLKEASNLCDHELVKRTLNNLKAGTACEGN